MIEEPHPRWIILYCSTVSAARRPTKMEVPSGEGFFARDAGPQSFDSAGMIECYYTKSARLAGSHALPSFKKTEPRKGKHQIPLGR